MRRAFVFLARIMQKYFESDVQRVLAALSRAALKQVPYAASVALNRTAQSLQKKMLLQLDADIHKPTPFTKRGLAVKRSTKRDLISIVGWLPKQAEYMRYQIEGGQRDPRKNALLMPGKKTRRNQYGNTTNSFTKRIKSELAAQAGFTGPRRNRLTQFSGKGGKVKQFAAAESDRLFVGKPVGFDGGAGIWRRINKGRQQKIALVFAFRDDAKYTPVYRLPQGIDRDVEATFLEEFKKAIAAAVASAR